ncbi:hypothetical protein GWK47_011053 [Chionoecetes opilio]|uniref:Uncharacterized protein n=1 Tax=Chionoecetes opilio TaxID=41210 RepID=A0A8J4Y400_CHIOP|nr:hypothetical protein GWK47_011053 [Chionoecetes opilio]
MIGQGRLSSARQVFYLSTTTSSRCGFSGGSVGLYPSSGCPLKLSSRCKVTLAGCQAGRIHPSLSIPDIWIFSLADSSCGLGCTAARSHSRPCRDAIHFAANFNSSDCSKRNCPPFVSGAPDRPGVSKFARTRLRQEQRGIDFSPEAGNLTMFVLPSDTSRERDPVCRTHFWTIDDIGYLTFVLSRLTVSGQCDLLKVLSHTSLEADRATLLYFTAHLSFRSLNMDVKCYSSATPLEMRMLDSVHHAGVRYRQPGRSGHTPIQVYWWMLVSSHGSSTATHSQYSQKKQKSKAVPPVRCSRCWLSPPKPPS